MLVPFKRLYFAFLDASKKKFPKSPIRIWKLTLLKARSVGAPLGRPKYLAGDCWAGEFEVRNLFLSGSGDVTDALPPTGNIGEGFLTAPPSGNLSDDVLAVWSGGCEDDRMMVGPPGGSIGCRLFTESSGGNICDEEFADPLGGNIDNCGCNDTGGRVVTAADVVWNNNEWI